MRPDWVLVPGDTNSALAAGLAASKLGFAVAHIEAGARSYDMSMPEEVNRRLLDHLSGLLFAPTATCAKNLVLEGIPRSRTIRSGDTMFDLFQEYRHKMMSSDIVERQGLANSRYVFVTVHRQSNIGTRKALADIARAILDVKEVMFVMPVHPHTRARMEEFGIYRKLSSANNIKLTGPLGYFETIRLITSARLVVTDSGGLQKEAFWAGTPCVTLRDTTEWTETIKCGANTLTGVDGNRMVAAIRRSLSCQPRILWKSSLFGNGQAARKIIATLEKR
jgi:UDP-N-acetylglucosamine 2-epimerase